MNIACYKFFNQLHAIPCMCFPGNCFFVMKQAKLWEQHCCNLSRIFMVQCAKTCVFTKEKTLAFCMQHVFCPGENLCTQMHGNFLVCTPENVKNVFAESTSLPILWHCASRRLARVLVSGSSGTKCFLPSECSLLLPTFSRTLCWNIRPDSRLNSIPEKRQRVQLY